jgi:hypothetical protein
MPPVNFRKGNMRAFTAAMALSALLTLGRPVMAEEIDSPIVGLWAPVSWTIAQNQRSKVRDAFGQDVEKHTITQVTKPFGEHPGGYILFAKAGHVIVLIGDDREARARALNGTYKVDGNRLDIHVDRSWNLDFEPQNFEVSGNKLTARWFRFCCGQSGAFPLGQFFTESTVISERVE